MFAVYRHLVDHGLAFASLWPRFMVNESEWSDSSSDQSSGNSNGAQELCADGDSSPVTAGTDGSDSLMNPEESHWFLRKPKQGADLMAITDYTALGADGPIAAVMRSDEQAWNTLIERHQHIIDAACRRYRLRPEDAADVSQTVWMKAIDNLDRIRELRAMPGWIKTTAMRAACTVLRSRDRLTMLPDVSEDNSADWSPLAPASGSSEVDARMLHAERRAAVRDGLAELTESHRALLSLLVADPPITYQQISDQLGLPVGSIGPTRARCLRKLAATPSIRALELGRGDYVSAADAA